MAFTPSSFLVVTSCVEFALLMFSIALFFSVSTCCFNLVTSSGNKFANSISLFFLSASALIVFIASVLAVANAFATSSLSLLALFCFASSKEIA